MSQHEAEAPRALPVRDAEVTRVCFWHAVELVVTMSDDDIRIVLEGSFRFHDGETERLVDPASPGEIAEKLVSLMGVAVHEVSTFSSGALVVVFDRGMKIEITSDPDYEAWELEVGRGQRIVALPGGGTAEWD